jgi:hypothetical protein
LNNLTPEDVYLARGTKIRAERQKIKFQTLPSRRRLHRIAKAA